MEHCRAWNLLPDIHIGLSRVVVQNLHQDGSDATVSPQGVLELQVGLSLSTLVLICGTHFLDEASAELYILTHNISGICRCNIDGMQYAFVWP